MPVINGVYLKDFPALPSSVVDANIIPIAESGNQVAYRTTVGGIVTDARVTGKVLTGLSVTGGAIASTDTILEAFGKVQNQLNNRVTSVGLSMPSAFTVTNSPVTGTGTLTVTGAGLASQYIRGDGQLADFPTGGGGGSSVSYYLNGSVNQGTFSGNTYYEMNKNAILGAGTDFTISADGYIASFITDANDPNLLLIPGGNWNLEFYFQASSGGGSPSFYVELSKWNGSTFTAIASNSATPELIAFGTSIQPYFATLAVPETVLLATDRLAIRVYVNHSGRTITLHTENNTLCQIITTFTTGLQSLNGLTKQTQFFSVGTSGTDFNISSVTDTHTFNLPDASATARGVVNTGSQSFAGNKFFGGNVSFGTGSSSVFDGSNGRLILDKLRIYNTVPSTTYSDFVSAATTNRSITVPDASGTLVLTSDLSGYLPLTGGTLTGALSGTSATFSGTGTFGTLNSATIPLIGYASTSNIGLKLIGTSTGNGNGTYFYANNGSTLLGSVNISGTAMAITNEQAGILYFATSGSEQARISSSGDFSIGTSSGGYKLNVNGTVNFSGALSGTSATFTASVTPLILKSTSATTMFTEYYYNTSTLSGYIGSGSGLLSGANNSDFIIRSEADFVVATNGNNRRLTITSGGNVGIGTTTDSGFKLDVNGTGRFSGAFNITNTSGGFTAANYLQVSGTTADNNNYPGIELKGGTLATTAYPQIILGNGGLGLTLSSGYGTVNTERNQISLNGSNGITLSTSTTGAVTTRVTIASGGGVTIANLAGVGSRTVNADANGLLSAASDSRLKQEVLDYKVQGLAEILKMQPRAYKWLKDIENRGQNATIEIGFFANEVASIIPSAAPMNNDGYYGFYDRAVIAALVNSVKELNARIIKLESK